MFAPAVIVSLADLLVAAAAEVPSAAVRVAPEALVEAVRGLSTLQSVPITAIPLVCLAQAVKAVQEALVEAEAEAAEDVAPQQVFPAIRVIPAIRVLLATLLRLTARQLAREALIPSRWVLPGGRLQSLGTHNNE
jgi:hypothetical protein